MIDPRDIPPDPLFVQRGHCTLELSTRGRDELLRSVIGCANREAGASENLAELVSEILDISETQISTIMSEHALSVHQWCPVLDEEFLSKGKGGEYDSGPPHLPPRLVLLLCVFMLTRRSCAHVEHVSTSTLYTALKQVSAIGQATGEDLLDVFRMSMLVAIYECGHGLSRQAYATLSSCVGLFNLIQLDMQNPTYRRCSEETFSSLKAAIIMLDRMIPLSAISNSLPIVCPTKQPLSMSIASKIEPQIPPPSPTPYASSPRKVHIRAIVALETGRVLEYSHALQYGGEPAETYNNLDAAVSLVIKSLVDKPQPHTWLHCDAIAMAFWWVLLLPNLFIKGLMAISTHLLLQQIQVGHLEAQGPSASQHDSMKAILALKYSRRMAWDMVKVLNNKVENEEILSYLPFAGLCCVIRAAIAVLETTQHGDEGEITENDIINFLRVLGWFSTRWSIGSESSPIAR